MNENSTAFSTNVRMVNILRRIKMAQNWILLPRGRMVKMCALGAKIGAIFVDCVSHPYSKLYMLAKCLYFILKKTQ